MWPELSVFLQSVGIELWSIWGIIGGSAFILGFIGSSLGFSLMDLLVKFQKQLGKVELVKYKKYERRIYWGLIFISTIAACFLAWRHEYRDVALLETQLTPTLYVDFQEPINFKDNGEGYFQGDDHSQLYRIKVSNPFIKAVANVQARISIKPEVIVPGLNLHFRHDNKKEKDLARSVAKGQDEFFGVVYFTQSDKDKIHVRHVINEVTQTIPRGEYLVVIRVTGNDVQDSDSYFRIGFDAQGRLTMKRTVSSEPMPMGPMVPSPPTHTE